MNDTLKRFFDKINFNDYDEFQNAEIEKVIVNKKKETWEVHIKNPSVLSIEIALKLIEVAKNGIEDVSSIMIKYIYDNITEDDILTYFKYYLNKLANKNPSLVSLLDTNISIENKKINIEVISKIEADLIKDNSKKVIKSLSNLGIMDYNINPVVNDEKRKLIKNEIKTTRDEIVLKKESEFNIIMGEDIKTKKTTPINEILGEENNIVIEAYLFGMDEFSSSRSSFKILTLKISDNSDSLLAKIFTKENDDFNKYKKNLKVGQWYKFRGYTKNDPYAKDIVLNIRDIVEIPSKDKKRKDNAPLKRVELHTHTMMSQMDGVVEAKKLLKTATSWGHKAMAFTDHNGAQSFPDIFHFVTDYNKGKEEKEHFKAIYGTELTLIDDSINIIRKPISGSVLNSTYCVFDLETTGFNASAGDSIIEIGAVLIQNGEILDRFDELIDPGRKLPPKITEVTNITDEMLAGKDNEEQVIKRFIKWFKDYPMVAHNAKFDSSFIEMAYTKYNLGEFKNSVIDTLEISRALDPDQFRHSLSALVKRWDIEWDENAHHRADYDAEGTAKILAKMLKKIDGAGIHDIKDMNNLIKKEDIYKFGRSYHVNILAKNKVGLKNLFKIISLANTKYLYKTPRILRSVIDEYREGLLIGSGCYESEVFIEARSKTDEELINIINYYDYVEVQPPECYIHLLQTHDFDSEIELENTIKKIINLTKEAGKIIVATGDVHQLNEEDTIYREIIVNQKVPGGGRHPLAKKDITKIPANYLRTTDEMIASFTFLNDEALAKEIVIDNPNKIADSIDEIEVIIDTGGIPFSPRIHSDDGKGYLDCPVVVTNLVYTKAASWYGDPLPKNIEERISKELYGDNLFEAIKEKYKGSKLFKEKLLDEEYKELHATISKGKDYCLKVVSDKLNKDLETASEDDKEAIKKKLKKPLGGIIGGGFDPIYLIAQRLVKHSNDAGFMVGSRGSVGSSFVATMMGITEVNPLPPHYRCPECKLSIFTDDNGNDLSQTSLDGYDLPDKECPKCHIPMIKDGHDMPFATFLGFNADKVPDIDLNFSDLNQAAAHAYTKVLFGEDNVYRAGTVGTVADKTAYGYVMGYFEDKNIIKRSIEIERLALGITGIKRTTGQHPGGIVVVPDYKDVFDFTPFQYPADDVNAQWHTTHFDYHSIESCLLKLDILGHSDPTQLRLIGMQSKTDITKVPLDDKDTMKIFTSPDILGVTNEQILCNTGTLGIPEFGTPFTISLVEDTKPTTFAELIKISGLAHGTDVWLNNAQLLVKNKVVPFKEVIGCRDDIMVNLISWGMPPKKSFDIMEFVRKGRAVNAKKPKDPEQWQEYKEMMAKYKIPEWYIDSCGKIQYMFPKAHACAYVINAYRIAWYKVHMPVYFYASWLSSKATDFDIESMIKGYSAIKLKIESIIAKGYDATNKDQGLHESLNVALEATARGMKFLNIDLYKSDATVWLVKSDNEIYPPFSCIDGLGDTVAKTLVEARENGPFISIEDVMYRGKVNQTTIEKMRSLGIFANMPESNQLSLF